MSTVHFGVMHDVFVQALHALKENRLRTVLSILGIAVGIGAVMVVGTVSQGIKQHIFAELKTYGLETLWIYRKEDDDNPYRKTREGSGIDNDDLKALQMCCPAVKKLSPVVYSENYEEPVRFKGNYIQVNLEGVGFDYVAINRDRLIAGRGLREEDIQRRQPVAIIGSKVRDELFGVHANPIGKELRWGDIRLTIIGMLQDKNRDFLAKLGAENFDINKRVLIPYTLYQQQLSSKDIHTLQAEAISLSDTQKALDEITAVLSKRHGERFEYTTESMEGWINTAKKVVRNVSLVGLLAASISLLVGGMGIMNIMSTSVVERTREIGIRKALGAYRRDILFQFLMEATVVSIIGGVLGLLLGMVAAFLIGVLSGYALGVSWATAIIALLVSIAVGLLSGYYPAHRAAGMKPVDALRYE